MMNPVEYINWVIGKPYKQGADGPDYFDCWGVIVHSFKEVEGIDLPSVHERDTCDLNGSAAIALYGNDWQECARNEADVFCCYQGDSMVHIGRILYGKAVHAAGEHTLGQVMMWNWRKVELFYKNIRYFKLCR